MRKILTVAAALLILCWPVVAAAPSRLALVVGISLYDGATGLPQLPQVEASARTLAKRVEAMPGYSGAVRLRTRRVTRESLLEEIRKASADAKGGAGLLVALLCAGDERGLMASDGILRSREVREALSGGPSPILLVDAGGAGDLPLLEGKGAFLASSQGDEAAWPLFLPDDDGRVDFVSAAAAGWCRAMERDGGTWRGDLGLKRCLGVEDLLLAGDAMAAGALPRREGDRVLDEDLGLRVVEALRPAVGRRLRKGREVPMADLRRGFDEDEREMLFAVLWSLASYDVRHMSGARRDRVLDAVAGRTEDGALRAVHRELLRLGMLESAPEAQSDSWRRLGLRDGRIALIAHPHQEGRLTGEKDLAVAGQDRRCATSITYGRFSGALEEDSLVRLDFRLFGTQLSGRWEGTMGDAWVRGDWQGRYDPRTRRVVGVVVGKKGSRELSGRFEGDVTSDGSAMDGEWEAFEKDGGFHQGHWMVMK